MNDDENDEYSSQKRNARADENHNYYIILSNIIIIPLTHLQHHSWIERKRWQQQRKQFETQ